MTEENFFDMFNRIHNPDYFYGKQKKTQEKKTKKKQKTRSDIKSDSGWATDKEFHKMKLAFPVNEGWLFSKDKHHVKVFASYDKDADTNEITFGDRTMIPLACVKKMIKLN